MTLRAGTNGLGRFPALRRTPKAFQFANLGLWSTDADGADSCLAEMQLSTRTFRFAVPDAFRALRPSHWTSERRAELYARDKLRMSSCSSTISFRDVSTAQADDAYQWC